MKYKNQIKPTPTQTQSLEERTVSPNNNSLQKLAFDMWISLPKGLCYKIARRQKPRTLVRS